MRSRRTFAAWLAILAMALQALWPLVAQAQPSSQPLVPICTVGGDIHYVTLDGKPAEKPAAATGEHCKLCVFGVDKAAIQQAPLGSPLRADRAPEPRIELLLAADLSAASCPPAPSRAPPAISL